MRHLLVLATALLALTAATAATASAQATGSAERFVLSGVVAFDDGDGKAWLQEPLLTGNRVVLVRRGDSVGPWRVTAIHKNRVELQGPGGAIFVPLHNADGAAVAAAGGPASATAAASAPEAKTPSVPLGDPSRREPIRQLMGIFQQAGAEAPAQAAPASSLPDFSGKPSRPTDRPPKTLYFGAGDPSRRETIGQMFGPR